MLCVAVAVVDVVVDVVVVVVSSGGGFFFLLMSYLLSDIRVAIALSLCIIRFGVRFIFIFTSTRFWQIERVGVSDLVRASVAEY